MLRLVVASKITEGKGNQNHALRDGGGERRGVSSVCVEISGENLPKQKRAGDYIKPGQQAWWRAEVCRSSKPRLSAHKCVCSPVAVRASGKRTLKN